MWHDHEIILLQRGSMFNLRISGEKNLHIQIYSTTLCPDILYKADFILAVVGQVSDGHVAHWPVIFNYYNL